MLRWITAGILVLFIVVVVSAIVAFRRDRPVEYTDVREHFKYGSIGSEPGVSLLRPVGGVLPPYWVFRALPTICRDTTICPR